MSYALITGAAKGIGWAISIELAKRSYNLLLIDKDILGLEKTKQEIEKLYGIQVHILHLDISEQIAIKLIRQWSAEYHKDLNIVINNAGFGLNGIFTELSIEEQLNLIDVNIKAQVAMTYTFLPILENSSPSYLLNICSTTAYQPVPYFTVYAASKAFILSFNRALRHELQNSNVSLSYLIPGPPDTDFVKRAGMGPRPLKMATKFNMTAEKVAEIAIKEMFKKKGAIIPGYTNKLNAFLPKYLPLSLLLQIGASIYNPKQSLKIKGFPELMKE